MMDRREAMMDQRLCLDGRAPRHDGARAHTHRSSAYALMRGAYASMDARQAFADRRETIMDAAPCHDGRDTILKWTRAMA